MNPAGIVTGANVLAILQVGATGFAVIMLYLGYSLLKTLIDQSPKSKEALEALRLKIRSLYAFLAVSLLMAVIGLAGQFFLRNEEYDLTIGVTPLDVPLDRARVLHGVAIVTRDVKSGRGVIRVGHKDEVGFDVTPLVLEQRALNTARAQALVATSSDGGFDEPK
jgi:hypothetical protein